MTPEIKNESDEDLMLLYQNGEYEAFTEIYERYAPKINGFLLSKTSNIEESADLTQQVFLRIHNNRARYNRQFPLIAWVFTITRNILIDHFRKKKHLPLFFNGDIILNDPSCLNKEEEDSLIDRARKAIEHLPENQKLILNQRFQEGLSFNQISENLGIPSQTIRKRISRLIRNLKEGLK